MTNSTGNDLRTVLAKLGRTVTWLGETSGLGAPAIEAMIRRSAAPFTQDASEHEKIRTALRAANGGVDPFGI